MSKQLPATQNNTDLQPLQPSPARVWCETQRRHCEGPLLRLKINRQRLNAFLSTFSPPHEFNLCGCPLSEIRKLSLTLLPSQVKNLNEITKDGNLFIYIYKWIHKIILVLHRSDTTHIVSGSSAEYFNVFMLNHFIHTAHIRQRAFVLQNTWTHIHTAGLAWC